MSDVDDMIEDDYDPNELVSKQYSTLFHVDSFLNCTCVCECIGLFVRVSVGARCRPREPVLQFKGSQGGQPESCAGKLQASARARAREGRMGLSSSQANDQNVLQNGWCQNSSSKLYKRDS